MTARVVTAIHGFSTSVSPLLNIKNERRRICVTSKGQNWSSRPFQFISQSFRHQPPHSFCVLSCLSSLSSSPLSETGGGFNASTRLYVSGLSFRTTEDSLRNAFQNFGQLIEVNLVMDKIANRPRGFAFLRYATEDESKKAIEGMHGKFLDGRVIFVEVAKPRSELRRGPKQNPRPY